MQWSMPHRVLQVVAALIVFVAISAFALGIVNAPTRGRMPGEKYAGGAGATPIAATDATPLSQDRIEGAFQPRELTDEEKEKLQAEKEARQEAAEAAEAAKAAAATAPPGVVIPTQTAPTAAAEAPPPPPPPEEAPH